MLDERFAERVEEIDELLANDDDLLTQVREGGASWVT